MDSKTGVSQTFLHALFLVTSLLLVSCGGSSDTSDGADINARNFPTASVVVGQNDFNSTSPNQAGTTDANTIAFPFGNPSVSNGVLYIPDSGNNRLLGFSTIPDANNSSADFVLGQVDFTSSASGTSDQIFADPRQVVIDAGKMAMDSQNDHRVLIWNTAPSSGGISANVVVGQPDFISAASACTESGLNFPESVALGNNNLIVSDRGNSRVLIWDPVPVTNQASPNIILGQVGFTSCTDNDTNNDGITDNATAATLAHPSGVWTDGTRLVVADTGNNRVLIWNNLPAISTTPADVVLGQSNFSNISPDDDNQDGVDDGHPTARTLDNPYGVYSDGVKLYVTDSMNNRVLIWNTFPVRNFTPANIVYGQSDFFHQAPNDDNQDGIDDSVSTARTLNYPTGVYSTLTQLIVNDSINNRYLIFNVP